MNFGGYEMCKIKQVVLFLCVLGIPVVAFALGTENFGDRPLEISCDWYDGVAEVAKSPGLVYSRWINGSEIFCYKADADEFNEVLQKFAAISSPVRRLYFEAGPGTIKSLMGEKEFAFNWKLQVISGIHLSMIIGDNIERKDENYPCLTLFLDDNDINVERLNIPAGIDVIISERVGNDPLMSSKIKKLACWADVAEKWRQFICPHLDKIRNETGDLTVNCIEIRSPEISKYLTKHRIFAIETTKPRLSNLFAVSVSGKITDLSKEMLGPSDSEHRLKYLSISQFMRVQEIKIAGADSAIAVVKLAEQLFSAPRKICRLKLDSNYYTVFDSRPYSSGCKENDWQYNAQRQEGEWLIKKNPVSPSQCHAYQKSYRITVDQNDLVREIWGSGW